jgi:hypothetical protein
MLSAARSPYDFKCVICATSRTPGAAQTRLMV